MKAIIKKKLGFTLIELLIVIGILGVLVVAVLLTLNPGEAQRKARDAARVKDAGTLQAILDQISSEGVTVTGCLTTAAGCNSTVGGTNCANTNWLGMNVCTYAQSVPNDPLNGSLRNFANGTSGLTSVTANYKAAMSAGTYEINARQESTANARNLIDDGGNSSSWFEVGSDVSLDMLTN